MVWGVLLLMFINFMFLLYQINKLEYNIELIKEKVDELKYNEKFILNGFKFLNKELFDKTVEEIRRNRE